MRENRCGFCYCLISSSIVGNLHRRPSEVVVNRQASRVDQASGVSGLQASRCWPSLSAEVTAPMLLFVVGEREKEELWMIEERERRYLWLGWGSGSFIDILEKIDFLGILRKNCWQSILLYTLGRSLRLYLFKFVERWFFLFYTAI